MDDRTLTTDSTGAEPRKARWHAPTLKRLDVDLTAGNKRNSNDPGGGRNQFANS